MFKFKSLISEVVSPLLYHITDVGRAINILKENKFRLTPAFGTDADLGLQKGKLYFLSTSRIKYGGYSRSLGDKGYVNIELDGRKLGNNHQSVNVDYWDDEIRNIAWQKGNIQQYLKYDENEERIVTDEPEITPADKYIKSLHVSVGDPSDVKENMKEKHFRLQKLANKYTISAYFYTNFENWKKQIEARAYTDLDALFREEEYGEYDDESTGYYSRKAELILGAVDLFEKDSVAELTDHGKNMYNKVKKGQRMGFEDQFKNEIHNNKSNPDVLDVIKKLAFYMKKNNVNTIPRLINVLQDKAEKLARKDNKEVKEKYSRLVRALIDVYQNRNKQEIYSTDLNKASSIDVILKYFPFNNGRINSWDNDTQESAFKVMNEIQDLIGIGSFQNLKRLMDRENIYKISSFIKNKIRPVLDRIADNEGWDRWNQPKKI